MFLSSKISVFQLANIYSTLRGIKFNKITSSPLKILMCNHSTELKEKNLESTELKDKSLQSIDASKNEKKISKAMRAYLERAQLYDTFMKQQHDEYEIGRRHLANMMGEDPETFTQDDINKAVEYLMPSALEKPCRPIFEHPTKLFPSRKEAEFDDAGRPFHYLFYTKRPNYFQALHEISIKLKQLDAVEDKMIANGMLVPDEKEKAKLTGLEWMNAQQLENLFIEQVSKNEYEQFIMCIKRLHDHPYSNREKQFLERFCVELKAVTQFIEFPPLLYDQNGRPFATAKGYRKNSVVDVVVRGNGTGKVDIDGKDISFFEEIQDREQVMFPLHFTGFLNKVDFEAKIISGNTTFSGAIRLGLSHCLCSFVPKEMVERMRIAGLLTKDPRVHERQKVGQLGARRKQTWKKR